MTCLGKIWNPGRKPGLVWLRGPQSGLKIQLRHLCPLREETDHKDHDRRLVALCYDCNQKKGNMLYLPYGFYSALRDKPRYHQMQELVADWFATVKDAFDMERFPLIAPRFWQQIEIRDANQNRRRKPMPYIPSFQLRWEYVGNSLYDEVQAVTRVDIREERASMNRLSGLPEDHLPWQGSVTAGTSTSSSWTCPGWMWPGPTRVPS